MSMEHGIPMEENESGGDDPDSSVPEGVLKGIEDVKEEDFVSQEELEEYLESR